MPLPIQIRQFHSTFDEKCSMVLYLTGTCKKIPSLTVKFIKTPLKALFYLGFSAVSFRFTI